MPTPETEHTSLGATSVGEAGLHYVSAYEPSIRRVGQAEDFAYVVRHGLPEEKTLAVVVRLLESTLIRIGDDEYVRQNESLTSRSG